MSGMHGHKSSISQRSRSVSQFLNDSEELTDAELIKQVTDIKEQIKILTLENEIFENTIMRLEPALMNGVQQALEYANKLQSSSSLYASSFIKSKTSTLGLVESMASPSRMLASPSRVSTRRGESSAKLGGLVESMASPSRMLASPSRVSTRWGESSAKLGELVSNEMEIVKMNLERVKNKASSQRALLKAQLEEISICDSQIGKLRLRTSTLNTQYSKLKGQIRVKTELNESLRPVDFEKLKIENGECQKSMMEQNTYLTNVLDTIKSKERQMVELGMERDIIRVQAESLYQHLEEVRK
ncbi:Uncharacterized protein OBRU01_13094, partial [Operophtera brumata]